MATGRFKDQLSREDMHRVIDEGGSVLLPGGRIVTSKADLPGEAEISLLLKDTARAKAAKDDIAAEILQKQKQLADIEAAEQSEITRAHEEAAAAAAAPPAGPDAGGHAPSATPPPPHVAHQPSQPRKPAAGH